MRLTRTQDWKEDSNAHGARSRAHGRERTKRMRATCAPRACELTPRSKQKIVVEASSATKMTGAPPVPHLGHEVTCAYCGTAMSIGRRVSLPPATSITSFWKTR